MAMVFRQSKAFWVSFSTAWRQLSHTRWILLLLTPALWRVDKVHCPAQMCWRSGVKVQRWLPLLRVRGLFPLLGSNMVELVLVNYLKSKFLLFSSFDALCQWKAFISIMLKAAESIEKAWFCWAKWKFLLICLLIPVRQVNTAGRSENEYCFWVIRGSILLLCARLVLLSSFTSQSKCNALRNSGIKAHVKIAHSVGWW